MANSESSQSSRLVGSPSRLRDDSWGVRVRGEAQPGDQVEVKTRSGKSWQSTVESIVWSGTDRETGGPITLCRMEGDRKAASSGGQSTGAHPLVAAGKNVARMASRMANQQNDKNGQGLLEAMRALGNHVGMQVQMSAAGGPAGRGASPGRGGAAASPADRGDVPPPNDFDDPGGFNGDPDDIPF